MWIIFLNYPLFNPEIVHNFFATHFAENFKNFSSNASLIC